MKNFFVATMAIAVTVPSYVFAHDHSATRFIHVEAKSKEDRSKIAAIGPSIEFVLSDKVGAFATESEVKDLEAAGFKILGNFDKSVARGGHGVSEEKGAKGFPARDEKFHDYAELNAALRELEAKNPEYAKVHVIGKSLEGRDILAIQLNSEPGSLKRGKSNKPGAIFLGNHHAREHLSLEIPLMMAQYLMKNKAVAEIKTLLDSRDIWFVPMVNPDGAEFDIATGSYQMWRKNRRDNRNGTTGVDLNRNYSYMWGTGGSSTSGSSDTYMGPTPFSEPETQVVKKFVEDHLNAKVLLSFHTFSELILYPWGHKFDSISTARDLQVFEKMARTMAGWNKYKPQQASDLYIASGDTTDWAYGEHGIFAFTFELSPASMLGGGFYPGQRAIEPAFNANLKPVLYMIEVADDPYKVLAPRAKKDEFGFLPSLK